MQKKVLLAVVIILGALLLFETAVINMERNQRRYAVLSGPPGRMFDDDSFRQVQLMRQKMQRMFEQDTYQPQRAAGLSGGFSMRDEGGCYSVRISAPGLNKKEINIELKDGYLKVSGGRRYAQDSKDKDYMLEEAEGFVQVIVLPQDAKASGISSEYKNNALVITIPKEKGPGQKSVRIPVR